MSSGLLFIASSCVQHKRMLSMYVNARDEVGPRMSQHQRHTDWTMFLRYNYT